MDQYQSEKSAEQVYIETVYDRYVNKNMPKSKLLSGCLRAFLVGGLICAIGQGLIFVGTDLLDMEMPIARGFASICLVIVAATLTGLGVFDEIGKFAGAGSVVPITGFSNSMVAPAMEHKREGLVLGVGANMFKIAGPVIVCGVSASIIYGLLYFFLR